MKYLLKYLGKYKLESFFAPFFKLLEACFDLIVPIVVKSIIDVGIANGDNAYVVKSCILLVALGVVGLVCAVTAQYFAARAAVGSVTGIRHELFSHLQRLSYTETDSIGTSSMITRMTSDINQVQTGINMTLRLFLRSPIIVFGAMIMAFTINARSALTFTVLVPVLAIIVFGIILAGIPLYRKVQSKLDRVTAITRENLSGTRVIRAFNKEDDEIREFDEANKEHTSVQNFTGKITALMNPLTYVCVNLGIVALIYVAAPDIDNGSMTQGELVAMYNYMSQILVELVKLANTIFTVTKAVACGNRIQAVLDTPAGMEIKRNAEKTGTDCGINCPAVEFKNVSLKYRSAGAQTLSGIDFSVKPGMTVGIIGGTGSGKTSLVNMIPRFYDATQGEVRVFGKNVNGYELKELRKLIGIVPQKAVLFKGTIRSNLKWGKEDATDEEMWKALEIAQARDFVEQKEGKLDAEVKQNGRNFSGGQRQRLCIARALVSRAPILIFDDSSSALDYATDARLRRALASLDYSPTVFIISQRTSSISHADMIIVLEDGEFVGKGSHEELLESCPVYKEIYDSQFMGATR